MYVQRKTLFNCIRELLVGNATKAEMSATLSGCWFLMSVYKVCIVVSREWRGPARQN